MKGLATLIRKVVRTGPGVSPPEAAPCLADMDG